MKMLTVTAIFTCTFELYLPKRKAGYAVLQEALHKLCGGFTIQDSNEGSWLDAAGKQHKDTILVYQVLCHRSRAAEVQEAIEQEIRRQLDAGEQSVLLIKDGHGVLYAYTQPFNSN